MEKNIPFAGALESATIFNRLAGEQRRLSAFMNVPVNSKFCKQAGVNVGIPVDVDNWGDFLSVCCSPYVQRVVTLTRSLTTRIEELRAQEAAARDAGDTEEADRLLGEIKKAKQKKSNLKSSLPIFIFGGRTHGKARKDENIDPSIFYALDLDNPRPDATAVWRACLPHAVEAGVVAAFISPGGGLKIIFKRELDDILADQRRVFNALGLDKLNVKFDTGCHDPSRATFVCREEDILYFNAQLAASPTTPLKPASPLSDKQTSPAAAQPASVTTGEGAAYPDLIAGVSRKAVARQWLMNQYGAEVPPEGERHNRLTPAAAALRWIVDFDPLWLAQILPPCGLGDAELRGICESACKLPIKGQQMPDSVRKAIDALKPEAEHPAWDEDVKRPVLPPGWRELLGSCPREFYDACLLSSLPLFGTLAGGARAMMQRTRKDDEGRMESPTFFVVNTAPPASGKSVITRLFDLVTADLARQDREQAEIEEQWKEKKRRLPGAKELPPRPQTVRRVMPTTSSNTEFLRRIHDAHGLSIIEVCWEIQDALLSQKRGPWADRSAIDRLGYDNAWYGTEHAAEDSYNVPVQLFYNKLLCGTPGQVAQYFRDTENGTITRFIIVDLPANYNGREPRTKRLTEEEQAALQKLSDRLQAIGGGQGGTQLYDLGFLDNFLEKWVNHMGDIGFAMGDDPALGTLRKRVREIAFRAGLLVAVAWDASGNWSKKQQGYIKQFAHYVAATVLRGQMAHYATQLRAQAAAVVTPRRKPYAELLQALPEEFNLQDAGRLAAEKGITRTPRKITYDWKRAGLVQALGKGAFKKTAKPS